MYEIKPVSVKQFILDRNIQFPRFQRKQTWDDKKNFQLVISVFKDYPMGVCIISKQLQRSTNKITTYLLDGRQRRNVFKMMYDNPENICLWARKFLNYKNSTMLNDLKELFDTKVSLYLEEDDDEYERLEAQSVQAADEVPLDEIEEESNSRDYGRGLDLLFKIISTFYKTATHNTGFSEPFDFNKYLNRVPYIDLDPAHVYVLNGTKLKNFIDEYRRYCEINDKNYEILDVFYDYILTRCSIKPSDGHSEDWVKSKLKAQIQNRWNDILLRMDLVNEIDNTLNSAQIGIIEVSSISPSDSQKIFNIINSEGVKLTAAEVLSASANWNKKLNNPSQEMQNAACDLYSNMNIPITDVVKWDVPATILARLGKNLIFKDLSWDSKEKKAEFEKKITLGFKIFAGRFKGRITKDDIAVLGTADINWDEQSEVFLGELKTICHLIEGIPYFKVLKSWQTTIMDIASDSVALDFLFEMYFDWKRKGSPTGYSAQTAKFQKNCIVLLDQLIYEYINLQWRGSSDSKIAKNIAQLNDKTDVFVPIAKSEWEKMLNQIFNNLTVNDSKEISYITMKPLLYHAYCLNGMYGPVDAQTKIDIDHIIPQLIFKQSAIAKKELIQDSLFNLALLPKRENISKGGDRLKNIEDSWLKTQIVHYECVPEEKFEEFSNVNNYESLFTYRKTHFFDKAFGEQRDNLLNN